KLRSILTLLGIIIGVMSVIAVLSFVEGLNRFVSEKLLNAGSNVFYVDPYGLVTSQDAFEAVRNNPHITLEDGDALQGAIPHATMIVAQAGTRGTARYRNKEVRGVSISGRGPGYDVIDDLTIARGRHLTELDDQRRRTVCVVGSEIAEELFPGLDPLHHEIRLGAESYEVVGVVVAKGKLFGQSQDRFATIPIRTFQKFKQERGEFGLA